MKIRRGLPLLAALLAALPVPSPTSAQQLDPALTQGLAWRSIGPHRGGRTKAVVGVPGRPGLFYAGFVNGGVWKSTDYGRVWTPIFDDQPTGSIGAIAVAPSDPDRIYVGSGEGMQRPDLTVGDGIYRSDDGGVTWTHLGLRDGQQIPQIAVDPRDADRFFVAVLGHPYGPNEERGVFRSTDGGRTYEQVLYHGPTVGAAEVTLDPLDPDVVYAALWEAQEGPWENAKFTGPGSGLFKSGDGGTTWRRIGRGLPTGEEGLGRVGFALAPSRPARVYAIVASPEEQGGLYRSDDAGETFTRIHTDPRLWGREGDFHEVRVDPQDPDLVYVANIVAWKSTDGGRTFEAFRGAPGGDDYQRIWIDPTNGRVMALASDQGVVITVNGGETFSSWYNQPTAQFYHVSTDNAFPYRVCGGQQESGSACVRSRSDDGQITLRDWHPVGVEEYGYVAPDPLDPDIVYGGKVTRFDRRTGDVQQVGPRPLRGPDYFTVRTQPVLFSPTDPKTLYYAANTLWKTTDGARTWEQISPELARTDSLMPPSIEPWADDPAATAHHRGVIYTVAPSYVKGEWIWAGTDDGLVHVTRDGGATWTDVTPRGLPESQVNAIDASPHAAGTAWVAVTRYKLGDFTPMAFRTTDYGASWTPIGGGLPAEHWVRVVREDTERPGLLYAGTELGAFVSFDAGAGWQPLQLNLPVTPVTDLKVHRGDLVAATQGRSFWILDDLTPLRELAADREGITRAPVWLFETGPAYRQGGGGFGGGDPTQGKNPPNGAVLQFHLREAPQGEARMDILDAAGTVVRTYTTEPGDGPGAPGRLGAKAGMNRMLWDLHRERVPAVEGLFVFGSLAGGRVPPGTYTARLSVDGLEPVETRVDVRDIPQVAAEVEEADHRAREALLADIRAEITQLHAAVTGMGDVRGQVEGVLGRTREHPDSGRIAEAGAALSDSIAAVDSMLVQRKWTTGQDPTVFPTRLNQFLIYLHGAVAETPGAPTQGMRERFEALRRDWGAYRERVQWILGPGVDGFNRLLEELGVPAVGPTRRIVS